MDQRPRTIDGSILDLDRAETIKRKILTYERLNAHVFCFVLALIVILLCVDALLLASDVWGALSRHESVASAISGLTDGPLTLKIGLYVMLGFMLLLGLAHTRAIGQLQRRQILRVRLGAAAAMILLVVFISYHIGDYARAQRLVIDMAALFSVPFANWAGMLELALLVGVTLLQQAQFNQRAAARLTEKEAFILRDEPSQAFKGRMLRSALGIPRIVDYLATGRLRASGAFALANVLYAVSNLFIVVAVFVALAHWIDVHETCGPSEQACIEQKAYLYLGVAVIAAVVALLIAPVIGALVNGWGQRQVRFSVDQLLARDERPPILFLRPFKDDQVELPAARVPFLARIGRWLAGIRNLDSLLLEEGTPYGPVVAIGNPDDDFPPYGAARGYFDHKTWQGAVEDLAKRSKAIIICIDDFEGVWWEVENVVTRHLDKTLMLLHPRHAGSEASAALLQRVAVKIGRHPRGQELSAAVDAVPATAWRVSLLGAFVTADGRLQLAVSSTMSGLAFLLATRMFLRSKWGLS